MSFKTTRAPLFDLTSLPLLQTPLTIPCHHPLVLPFQKLSMELTVLTAHLDTIAGVDSFQGADEKVGCFVDC